MTLGPNIFSPCCHGGVIVAGGREGTHWHECVKCGRACDPKDLGRMVESLLEDLVSARVAAIFRNHPCQDHLASALDYVKTARVLCATRKETGP